MVVNERLRDGGVQKNKKRKKKRRRKRTSNKSKRSGGDTDMGAARNHCHRTRSAHSVHPQSHSQSPSQQHHDWGRHMLLTRATDIRHGPKDAACHDVVQGWVRHVTEHVTALEVVVCWAIGDKGRQVIQQRMWWRAQRGAVEKWFVGPPLFPIKLKTLKPRTPKHTTVLSSFWFEPLRRLPSHKKLVPPDNVFCVWASGRSGPRFKECLFSLWPQTHKRHTH